MDAGDVEQHEHAVHDGPPERSERAAAADELVQVGSDADIGHGAGRHDLQTLGQACEERSRVAHAMQRKHIGPAACGEHGRQLCDRERQQHVEHCDHRERHEQAVKACDQRGLPAEEVAAHDGADTQRPQMRRSCIALLGLHRRCPQWGVRRARFSCRDGCHGISVLTCQ